MCTRLNEAILQDPNNHLSSHLVIRYYGDGHMKSPYLISIMSLQYGKLIGNAKLLEMHKNLSLYFLFWFIVIILSNLFH